MYFLFWCCFEITQYLRGIQHQWTLLNFYDPRFLITPTNSRSEEATDSLELGSQSWSQRHIFCND